MQNIRTSKLLEDSGIEATAARTRVLDVCLNANSPLSVADVAKKVGSTAHLATIYRTLEKLATANLLTRVDFQEGKFRYEYLHDHHHHAVCESCGKVAEVQDENLESMTGKIIVEKGFSITRHALELFGLCKSCQQKG